MTLGHVTRGEKKKSWSYIAQKFIEYLLKYILYRTVQLALFWCSQERSLTDALSCNHQLGIVMYANVKQGAATFFWPNLCLEFDKPPSFQRTQFV